MWAGVSDTHRAAVSHINTAVCTDKAGAPRENRLVSDEERREPASQCQVCVRCVCVCV